MPELFQRTSPYYRAAFFKKPPTLVVHGQLDYRVPETHGIELFQTLQKKGIPSHFLYYPNENLWILKPQNPLFWYKEVLVTAVYSEMKRRDGKRSSKYIVSSDPSLSAREIVETYRRRWAIETWHKEMKQPHGFRDCRSSSFRAFESHINFCLAAYNLQRCHDPGLPKPGTTVTEYTAVQKIKDVSACLNQFNGVSRFKKAANEALAAITLSEAA